MKTIPQQIAETILSGFNRHYRLFRAESAAAKMRFESAQWHAQQRAQRDRIAFYDTRVHECVELLNAQFHADRLGTSVWPEVKLHFIALLIEHHQPELAETFFNSVTCKILHRSYFRNHFIFVRPAISVEYIENTESDRTPTFRAYYPGKDGLRATLREVLLNFDLQVPFENLERDIGFVLHAIEARLQDARLLPNFQLQVLCSLFYRNKGAYVVGRIINGSTDTPFALPVLHVSEGSDTHAAVRVDAALFGQEDMQMLFSFARAYFMVDMEIPSAYVQFLRIMMPKKPRAELYNALGLAKQGKTLFYRDFLFHLRHSSDRFRISPGIPGMVMLVFDLPSFPFVFKIIKDYYPAQKETTRELIKSKYLLVKQHDRVGRMADTMEYSMVAFPRTRFEPELIEAIDRFAPSQIEIDQDNDEIIIHHLYIERRMFPLNLYLQEAFDTLDNPTSPPSVRQRAQVQVDHAVTEYGYAIKDLVAANIFPGDMLWKNFGITHFDKVVFYDYDEIEYITESNFRRVPKPRNEEDEMSGEVWYTVAPRDVFPETFGSFLLSHPRVREAFMRHHADLLDVAFWQAHKERINAGQVLDVFPYEQSRRFHLPSPASRHIAARHSTVQ